MGCAIGLRGDFDGALLRRLSRATKSANQARRVLALALILDGGSRSEAAKIAGVGLQIVRALRQAQEGDPVQCSWPGWPPGWQSFRPPVPAQ